MDLHKEVLLLRRLRSAPKSEKWTKEDKKQALFIDGAETTVNEIASDLLYRLIKVCV